MAESNSIIWEGIKFAWRGSISRSGAWAPVVGALALWLGLYLMGYQIVVPTSISGGVALFLMCAGAAWIIIFIGRLLYYPYAEIEKLKKELAALSPNKVLQIIYDTIDVRNVRILPNPYPNTPGMNGTTRYYVGLRNIGRKTIVDVSLRALHSNFVVSTISVAHQTPGRRIQKEPILAEDVELHPEVTEYIELFGIPTNVHDVTSGQIERFTLEARARDTPLVRADFEYSPNTQPAIRLVPQEKP
jgi:hypothetical protein